MCIYTFNLLATCTKRWPDYSYNNNGFYQLNYKIKHSREIIDTQIDKERKDFICIKLAM